MAKLYDHPAISRFCFPDNAGGTLGRGDSARPIDIELPNGEVLGAYWSGPIDRAPVLYLLHGGNENVSEALRYWPDWARSAGLNLFTIDYPGVGTSPGEPSISRAAEAARAGMRYLLSRPEDEVPAILILGRSLGSVFAMDVAAAHNGSMRLCGLGIETGIADLGQWLIRNGAFAEAPDIDTEAMRVEATADFDARQRLEKVTVPVLILQPWFASHVPVQQGEQLVSWTNRLHSHVVLPRGEHDNAPELNEHEYRSELASFVTAVVPRDPEEPL